MPILFNDPNSKFSPQLFNAIGAGLLSGNTWNEQVANAGLGANTAVAQQQAKQQELATKNQTVAALQAHPDLANAVSTGAMTPTLAYGELLKRQQQEREDAKPKYQVINGKLVQVNAPDGIKVAADFSEPKSPEYKSVGDVLFNTQTGEWIKPPADMVPHQTDYGLQPVWLRDPETKQLRLGVPGKDGSFKLLDTPQNMELLPGVNSVDTGTAVQQVDKRTGQPINVIPKDVAGEQAAKEKGKALTEAQVQLSGARQTSQMVRDGVQDLINDPALDQALGPVDSRLPTLRPSTARVEAKINQLTGQAFMQARQLLKGGGQITDYEGRKAEEAFARLSRAQNKEDFTKALTDFNSAVQDGLRKLEAQAKGNFDYDPNPAQQTDRSDIDDLVEQYRTKK